MNWFTGLILYVLIWWTVLFAVLPIGTHPAANPDSQTGWRGVPEQPRLMMKVIVTTLVAAIVWFGAWLLITSDYISFRHGWFAARSTNEPDVRFDAIAHIDHSSGRRATYVLPQGDVTSEPVFVERSAKAGEGDGWLLAVVYRSREDRSDLVVLDAQHVEAGPIATAKLPRRVPFGFHGSWLGQN